MLTPKRTKVAIHHPEERIPSRLLRLRLLVLLHERGRRGRGREVSIVVMVVLLVVILLWLRLRRWWLLRRPLVLVVGEGLSFCGYW